MTLRGAVRGVFSAQALDRANELAAATKLFAEDAATKERKAKRVADGVVSFKPNPPIDGLLHSVEFIVTYGGSVSPTWTLLLWKGPGTLPGLSAQGVRTNSLNIALGPASEQTRLITKSAHLKRRHAPLNAQRRSGEKRTNLQYDRESELDLD